MLKCTEISSILAIGADPMVVSPAWEIGYPGDQLVKSPRLRLAALILALTLSACVTPRLHSPAELSSVAGRCRVPAGDLVQEADTVKLLMLYTVAPSAPQLDCVSKWARKRRLHLAYIEAVEQAAP